MWTPRDACPGGAHAILKSCQAFLWLEVSVEFLKPCQPWKVLSCEFRRRPTGLANVRQQSDRVGRRGLFEHREDFPRLPLLWLDSLARFPGSIPWLDSLARFSSSLSRTSQRLTFGLAWSTRITLRSSASLFNQDERPRRRPHLIDDDAA